MRTLVLGLCFLLLGAARGPSSVVDYTLSPEVRDGAITALDVTVRFAGDASGVTRFDWAPHWAGEARLAQWSRDLTVAGARSTEAAPHGGRVIHAAPGAPITVRYRVVSAYAADPTVDDSREPNPVVRPTWFYAVGEALFATPVDRDHAPARFTWAGPPGIGFASDLEHPGMRTVDDLIESVVIGGRDLRVTRSTAGGAPLRAATIGRYAFDLPAFDALVGRVITAERGFWRERTPAPFLVTMAPIASKPGRSSYSGAGRGDAFALWGDATTPLDDLGDLLAHEYFHSWNSRQLGRLSDGSAEPQDYWLSEGFTDFYARRLLLRAGVMTPERFAASWNEALRAYAGSPWRTAPNARAAAAFWTDEQAEKLPYQRGAMLAAMWDRRLARVSGGMVDLDTVLRDQRRRATEAGATVPLATRLFISTAQAHGLDVRADLARYVDRGEPVLMPADTFGRCASVATSNVPVFEYGWNVDATEKADNVVTGLDPASPAYAAGLRDGMRLVRRESGRPGDARVDYVIIVSDAGTERRLRFTPAGKRTETVQELRLDAARFAAEPGTCRAALAG